MQALTDEDLNTLSGLISLRELSLSGADRIKGAGLAVLRDLPHLQVSLWILSLKPTVPSNPQ